jgi:hypothetical protein
VVTTSSTSYTHSGLSANTTYYYRVRATGSGYNASDYTTNSATTSAATLTAGSVEFTSANNFSIALRANTTSGTTYGVSSNRTFEYSTDGVNFVSWNGSVKSVTGGNSIWVRGTITANGSTSLYTNFTFPTGSNIKCNGKINWLSDGGTGNDELTINKTHCYYRVNSKSVDRVV